MSDAAVNTLLAVFLVFIQVLYASRLKCLKRLDSRRYLKWFYDIKATQSNQSAVLKG